MQGSRAAVTYVTYAGVAKMLQGGSRAFAAKRSYERFHARRRRQIISAVAHKKLFLQLARDDCDAADL